VKQVYAYCSTSSEILKRAGSVDDLLLKFKQKDKAWLIRKLEEMSKQHGLSCSVNFYEKSDVHGDDNDAIWIDGAVILTAADQLGIYPVP